jgi:hypothetical protein
MKHTATSSSTMAELIPGKYSVAHYRAEYGREVARHPKLREPKFIQNIAINSLRCAIELQPNDPIYFASDNRIALETVQKYAEYVNYPIITFDRDEKVVLKLDDIGNITDESSHDDVVVDGTSNEQQQSPRRRRHPPSDYYSTFVDLYLAGEGNCVAFGRGGFGRFANLLSYNATCSFKHVKQFYAVPCRGLPPINKNMEALINDGFRFPTFMDEQQLAENTSSTV